MTSLDERSALALGALVLLGLATLTAAVPVVGYVLLGLVIVSVAGLLGGAVVLWWRTRWQPPDTLHRPVPVPATRDREVA